MSYEINVLIKDGNRTVNWEHQSGDNVGYVLRSHGFKYENLLAVNFKPFTGNEATKLSKCGMTKYKGIDRVFFILKQEEKKEEEKHNDDC